MSYSGETNTECPLTPLDSARFIMERARHVSIDLPSLQKLATTVFQKIYPIEMIYFDFLKISSAVMDGECTTEDCIGSDVGPPTGDSTSMIDW